MNILHISTARALRGGERQLLLLHRELLQRGVDSSIAARSRSELSEQGLPGITRHHCNGTWDLPGLMSLIRECGRGPLPLLHCHDGNAFTVGSLVGAIARAPVIVSRKVLFPVRPTILNRWKYSRCAHVICVSNAVAAATSRIARHTPTSVIHDAPDLTAPLLDRADARRRLGLSAGDFVVGTVGYFTPEKNLRLLLDLAKGMEPPLTSARFVVIGDVDRKTRSLLNEIPSILAPGPIPNAVTVYRAFDAYISTSRSEGLGSGLLDAVVRDIPAVALDSGGGRDMFGAYMHRCTPTPALFIAKVREVLREFDRFAEEAAHHGAWARTVFSVQNFVKRHLDVYGSIAFSTAGSMTSCRHSRGDKPVSTGARTFPPASAGSGERRSLHG